MYRSKDRRKRKMRLGGLLCLFLIMTVGYSAFSSQLDIKGSSMVTSKWDIEITDLQLKQEVGEAENVSYNFDALTANMEANFYMPGDEITYEVTVSNLGTIDAVLDSIKINMASQDVIQFKVDGITSGEELAHGTSTKFDVIMKYNENITSQPGETSIDFSMDLNYLQKGNLSNFANADSDTSDVLAITGIDLTPTETSVKAEVSANNAIKYYYSLDNDKWYETMDNFYTIYHLTPNTDYTMYIKAEDVNGEVVFSSKPFTTLDNTNPELKLTVGDNVKGDNGWYKGLNINIEASDAGGVKDTKYCVSSNDTCSPNTDLELTEGKGTYQFASGVNNQTLCVLVSDRKGNETTKCTEAYKIDSEDPTLSDMKIDPLENTMTITLSASDDHSGIYKYYYSKDSGKTYVESDSPNYTFTNLNSGDYLITAYVEDKAGNISELKAGSTAISATFCQENGINNLSDCVIATAAGEETNIEIAKQTIEAKGTPNFTVTSPAIVYSESYSNVPEETNIESSYYYIGTDYYFEKETGYYVLQNYNRVNDPTSIDYGTDNYYMCYGGYSPRCTQLTKLINVTSSVHNTGIITYTFKYYTYSQTVSSYDTSEVGLYSSKDDQGKTYYYRGSVANNYVKFANKYWRIIRVNGDGTLRLIYDGTTPHSNGETSSDRQIGTSAFNQYINDNTYVGYMYGNTNNFIETDSKDITVNLSNLNSNAKYYFGTSYKFDPVTRTFELAGDLHNGTLSDDEVGYYTCLSVYSNTKCQSLYYTIEYINSTSMRVSAKGYGTNSLQNAVSNITDSTIKTYLDNWYQNNLNNYNNVISNDAIFCNNRNASAKSSGSYNNLGYGKNQTIYHGYEQLTNWQGQGLLSPDLSCSLNDSFSVSNKYGNGNLRYSIGLPTIDEAKMAGGIDNNMNTLYYLYSGTYYRLMTPCSVYLTDVVMGRVTSFGTVACASASWSDQGVRPVINLDTTKVTFTGTGTMQDPYVIE